MDAKAKRAAFGLVGRLEELGFHRGGDVFCRPHLGHATFHPLGDAAPFNRRVAVGDDRILRGPERIEHPRPGRIGIGFDIEDGGEFWGGRPFFDLDQAFAKLHGGTGGIFREEAVRAARVVPQLAGQERSVEADKATIADFHPAGLDAESGLEDGGHLAQFFQTAGGVFAPDPGCSFAEERNSQRRDLAPNHCQDQHRVLQVAAVDLPAPSLVYVGRKTEPMDRQDAGVRWSHHPVQIEGEPLVERVEEMRETCPKG